jgi:glycosyltransferase involved in cell wall biosynthesis
MRIGFDAKRLFLNFTGLGNYSRFVVSALSNRYPEDTFVLFSPKSNEHHPEITPLLKQPNITTVLPRGGYRYMKSLWRSWAVSANPAMRSVDIFHGLSQELPLGLKRVKKVVTVHDLIYLRFPQFYNPVDVAIYKAKVKAACAAADIVIAISQQTADDLKSFLRVPEKKVRVVYQGCHPSFLITKNEEAKQMVRSKYGLPDQFMLNVGTVERRKNALAIVKALPLIPSAVRLPLVIVGRATEYKKEIVAEAERMGIGGAVHFVHDVSFADLPAIYQMASLFVYPSLFEGFGIPLVEAIVSGVPVVSSTSSCFSEAAGPASRYVDPHDHAELSHVLSEVLSNDELRKEMISISVKHVEAFSPAKIAGDLNAIYQDVLG